MSKYFIAVYTNACKDYCDRQFFTRLGELQGDNLVNVIDNTDWEKYRYKDILRPLCNETVKNFKFENVRITGVGFSDHQFHHNVHGSLAILRHWFLKSDCEYFLIIESDVIPPADLINRLEESISKLPADWGILGGLYYQGFHDYTLTGIQPTHHALSGCTVYRREVIEQYPFRISSENWAAFPDAWICHDVTQDGKYKIFNDHDIQCEHLHFDCYSRQSKPL